MDATAPTPTRIALDLRRDGFHLVQVLLADPASGRVTFPALAWRIEDEAGRAMPPAGAVGAAAGVPLDVAGTYRTVCIPGAADGVDLLDRCPPPMLLLMPPPGAARILLDMPPGCAARRATAEALRVNWRFDAPRVAAAARRVAAFWSGVAADQGDAPPDDLAAAVGAARRLGRDGSTVDNWIRTLRAIVADGDAAAPPPGPADAEGLVGLVGDAPIPPLLAGRASTVRLRPGTWRAQLAMPGLDAVCLLPATPDARPDPAEVAAHATRRGLRVLAWDPDGTAPVPDGATPLRGHDPAPCDPALLPLDPVAAAPAPLRPGDEPRTLAEAPAGRPPSAGFVQLTAVRGRHAVLMVPDADMPPEALPDRAETRLPFHRSGPLAPGQRAEARRTARLALIDTPAGTGGAAIAGACYDAILHGALPVLVGRRPATACPVLAGVDVAVHSADLRYLQALVADPLRHEARWIGPWADLVLRHAAATAPLRAALGDRDATALGPGLAAVLAGPGADPAPLAALAAREGTVHLLHPAAAPPRGPRPGGVVAHPTDDPGATLTALAAAARPGPWQILCADDARPDHFDVGRAALHVHGADLILRGDAGAPWSGDAPGARLALAREADPGAVAGCGGLIDPADPPRFAGATFDAILADRLARTRAGGGRVWRADAAAARRRAPR
ncbi:hypothetical protein JQC91_06245 [Jannaschia sp. Os4]|uniref:hypothetical protein n=1 Tax=Jannaschia sp. Os4 TaxID=2807617 RepID=UPI00193A3B99|nr:hypothetical protein [Jannaschia sp. Os4]MBM2575898.1 hypothetical protein [Jannaschia sp. Os4]